MLENMQQALDEGWQLIGERQKLIKIADCSELGWGVVAEYTDDSNDEKLLEMAEHTVECKALKSKKAKAGLSQKRSCYNSAPTVGQGGVGSGPNVTTQSVSTVPIWLMVQP